MDADRTFVLQLSTAIVMGIAFLAFVSITLKAAFGLPMRWIEEEPLRLLEKQLSERTMT